MGQFSWMDCKRPDKQIVDDMPRKVYLLVPEKFGGGHIEEACYDGYGHFGGCDVYDLVVDWNKDFIPELIRLGKEKLWHCGFSGHDEQSLLNAYNGRPLEEGLPEGQHVEKRWLGIVMACYDEDSARLPYPIKVTYDPEAVYEQCRFSPSDPNQGWPDDDFDWDDFSDEGSDDDDDEQESPFHGPENLLWDILKMHVGHKVEIAIYGDPDDPADICLEDLDTNEVILDSEIYTLRPRND